MDSRRYWLAFAAGGEPQYVIEGGAVMYPLFATHGDALAFWHGRTRERTPWALGCVTLREAE